MQHFSTILRTPLKRVGLGTMVAMTCMTAGAVHGESWYHSNWEYRTPLYVNSATPHDIHDQSILLEGLVDTAVLGSKIQSGLGDLRFTWLDPATGMETPLDHYSSRATAHALTDIRLAGPVDIRAGTGVNDSLHVNATHMRNNPGAVYHNGRVYMTYTVRGDNKNAVDLIVYDEATRTVEGPVRIADLLSNPSEELNEHRAPVILVDHDGYIHLVYGAHGGNMNLFYRRSTSPEDIGSFTAETTVDTGSNTYPNIIQQSDGSIYVFSRVTTGSSWDLSYYRSTDGGDTWSGEQRFVEADGWVAYKGAITSDPAGETIHVVWHWFVHAESGLARYRDVLYTWSDDGGQSWKKADGTSLGSTISRLSSDLDVVTEGTNLWVYDVDVDSQGRPHIIYGNVGAPYDLFHAYWDQVAQEWTASQVTTGSYAWGNIRVYPDDELRINILERLGTFNTTSLRSVDNGATWDKASVRYRSSLRDSSPEMPRPGGVIPPISSFWGSNTDFEEYGPLFMYPSSPEHAQATIYMYYGNQAAERSDVDDPSELMEFQDDFASMVELSSDWNVTTMGNGTVSMESGVGVAINNPDTEEGGRAAIDRTLDTPMTHGYYRTRVRFDSTGSNHYIATLRNGDGDGEWRHMLTASPNGDWRYQNAAGSFVPFPEPANYSSGVFHEVELYWDTRDQRMRVSVDGQSLTGHWGVPMGYAGTDPITTIMQRTQIGDVSSFTTSEAEVYGTPYPRDYSLDSDFEEAANGESRVEQSLWLGY